MAAAAPPLVPRIEAAANWADPANVVADMTSGARIPRPDERASKPKEAPKNQTVAAIARIARTSSSTHRTGAPERSSASMRSSRWRTARASSITRPTLPGTSARVCDRTVPKASLSFHSVTLSGRLGVSSLGRQSGEVPRRPGPRPDQRVVERGDQRGAVTMRKRLDNSLAYRVDRGARRLLPACERAKPLQLLRALTTGVAEQHRRPHRRRPEPIRPTQQC